MSADDAIQALALAVAVGITDPSYRQRLSEAIDESTDLSPAAKKLARQALAAIESARRSVEDDPR